MVKSTGAQYVILGHSERRSYYHETPEILKEKIKLALANNLKVIFCIGETLEEREAEKQNEVVKAELEGSVFNAGSSIQWLRDELGLIGTAHECDILAESVPDNGGVYLVSAFTGLGAPRWDMYARGAIVGLTRGSNKAHIARATLEGIAYQVKDLLDAMQVDAESPISVLRVDGGASVSSFLMQFQADMLRVPIDRPKLVETTAFGAAFLAGIASGVWESVDDIALLRQSDRIFKPEMDAEQAKQYHDNWLRAVGRAEKWSQE